MIILNIIFPAFEGILGRHPAKDELVKFNSYCLSNTSKSQEELRNYVEDELIKSDEFLNKFSNIENLIKQKLSARFQSRIGQPPKDEVLSVMIEMCLHGENSWRKLGVDESVKRCIKIQEQGGGTEKKYNPNNFIIEESKYDLFTHPVKEEQSEILFEDYTFPCDTSSLYDVVDKSKSIPGGAHRVTQWLRPIEFTNNPSLFVDGSESGDVVQGDIGNCWLLSAFSIVACRDDIVEHLFIVKPKDAKKGGRYVVRIYKEGEWREVEIDDRLPCDQYKKLVFGRCHQSDEIWVPLLEKAFAKLFGCYQRLCSGRCMNGLVDLTGGVSLPKIDITPDAASDEELWKQLHTIIKDDSYLVSCSIEKQKGSTESMGLIPAHAYAIIDCMVLSGEKLIKIRNPWGYKEWNGRWSDNSKEWTPELKMQVNETFEDDGTFFMCFEDFCTYWTRCEVVRVFGSLKEQEAFKKSCNKSLKWFSQNVRGEWTKQTSGRFFVSSHKMLRGDQFLLDLQDETEVVISLMQKDYRYHGDDKEENHCIGFYVVEYKGEFDRKHPEMSDRLFSCHTNPIVFSTTFVYLREISHVFQKLEKGQYYILPATWDENIETEYCLRVFAKNSNITLTHLPPIDHYYNEICVSNEVTEKSAGGCINSWKWILNDQLELLIKDTQKMVKVWFLMTLEEKNSINFDMLRGDEEVEGKVYNFDRVSSFEGYKSSIENGAVAEVETNKKLMLMPAFFKDGEVGKYNMHIFWRKDKNPSISVHMAKVDTSAFKEVVLDGEWNKSNAYGPSNSKLWRQNPQFTLVVNSPGYFDVILTRDEKVVAIGFHIFKDTVQSNVFAKPKTYTHATDVALRVKLDAGKYIVMPSTFKPDHYLKFQLRVISNCNFTFSC